MYRPLFELVWGADFHIRWPGNTGQICATPGGAPRFRGTATPIRLSAEDRTKANNIYDHWGQSISKYKRSNRLSPFTSKFDAFLKGKYMLTSDEKGRLVLCPINTFSLRWRDLVSCARGARDFEDQGWAIVAGDGRGRAQLQAMVRSHSLPAALVRRAKIVLLTEEGLSDRQAAERLQVSQPTVSMWRRRFRADRITGLHDELRPGRPRSHDDECLSDLLITALSSKPAGETHWSVRSLAEATHLSKSSVQRYLHLFGVQPHRTTSFKLSNDPFFIEKLRDIVGLYLNPPEDALVLLSHTAKNHIRLNQSHPETIFRVRMDGLKPSTTYYYKVTSMGYDGVSDGVESSVQQIATAAPGQLTSAVPPLE